MGRLYTVGISFTPFDVAVGCAVVDVPVVLVIGWVDFVVFVVVVV